MYKAIKKVTENDSSLKSTIEMKSDINWTSSINSSALSSLALPKLLFLKESFCAMI